MSWAALLRLALSVAKHAAQYVTTEQLKHAGADDLARELYEDLNARVTKSLAARRNARIDPDGGLRDDDGFRQD